MNRCTRVRALRSCSGDVHVARVVVSLVVHAVVGLTLGLIAHVVVVVFVVAFPYPFFLYLEVYSLHDAAAWPYGLGILCEFTAFLGSLRWPVGAVDMGILGVLFWEILILFEHWAGHRLLSEKVTRAHIRPDRPILFPSAPVAEGVEIRQRCQFVSSLIRALSKLPGGMGWFLPCGIGSHMARLRHLGWTQCSHGLTSILLESCHHQCLRAVCGVQGCPTGSAAELLDASFKQFPSWILPGWVRALVKEVP